MTDKIEELFVFGLDKAGSPRGARFKTFDDRIVSAAYQMKLTSVFPASSALAEIANKLPQGRLYASGTAFVPNIRKDLLDKIVAVLSGLNDSSTTCLPREPKSKNDKKDVHVKNASPSTTVLPMSWPEIAPGHIVLVHYSVEEGWWEADVLERENDLLTLKYRDEPLPPFTRNVSRVALLNPRAA